MRHELLASKPTTDPLCFSVTWLAGGTNFSAETGLGVGTTAHVQAVQERVLLQVRRHGRPPVL
jgi:hypothetical protein